MRLLLNSFVMMAFVSSGYHANAQIESWKNLVAMESTRRDVESVLGKPAKYFETYGLYDTEIGRFSVWYSDGKCLPKRVGKQYAISKGLFVGLRFTPNPDTPLSLYLSDSILTTRVVSEETNTIFYFSPDRRLVFEAWVTREGREMLHAMELRPAAGEESRLCGSKK